MCQIVYTSSEPN